MLRRPVLGLLALLAAPRSFALYEPPPHPALKHLPGTWRGVLTYRDWSKPDRLVTLPCRLYVSLLTPVDASLYFVFDDGPGKTVHSYDRWLFNFTRGEMVWAAAGDKEEQTTYRIDSEAATDEGSSLVLARAVEGKTLRQQVDISARALKINKVEVGADGQAVFRNGYELARADS